MGSFVNQPVWAPTFLKEICSMGPRFAGGLYNKGPKYLTIGYLVRFSVLRVETLARYLRVGYLDS